MRLKTRTCRFEFLAWLISLIGVMSCISLHFCPFHGDGNIFPMIYMRRKTRRWKRSFSRSADRHTQHRETEPCKTTPVATTINSPYPHPFPIPNLPKPWQKLDNLQFEKGPSLRGEHHIPQLCDKLGLPAFVSVAARHAAQQASRWDLVDGMMPSAVAAAAVLLVCSCWNPAACGKGKGNNNGRGGGKGRKQQPKAEAGGDGGKNGEEEALDVGPAAVSAAVGASTNALKRPFRAMYEQRGRLITLEFLESRAAKGVTLETLKPVLV